MADNKPNMPSTNQQAPSQPMQMPKTNIFGGNDAKRMSFDGDMPYSVSPTSTSFGLTGGILGGMQPTFNRDRRDSLKNMVHLQDFGTD